MKLSSLLLVGMALAASTGLGQTIDSHTTVRHHREVVDDGAQEVTQGEQEIAKKDYPAAEKDLLAATQKDAKNYIAWFDLGYVYTATDRSPQAIDAYRKSVAINSQVFESNLNLGILLAKVHDPEAEKFLRDATKLKPTAHEDEGWYRAWLMLGHTLEKTNPQEAITAFQNAAKYRPTDPEPHLAAAMLLESQKQYVQAAVEYQKAAESDPKSKTAIAGMVNSYSQAGKVAEAENAIRKFLELDPNNPAAHVQLGRLLAAQQKWADATVELEKGLQLQPGDEQAERQLANIYVTEKKFDAATPHVQAALKLDPSDPELHHWLAQSYIEQKKYSEAQAELINTLKLKPDFGEAYGDLAFVATEEKNYSLVLKALDARAKFLPEMPTTYFLRATAYDHLQDYKDASANYHKFLEVADGKFPDQEWQAKHRLIAIEPKK